jgi:hypothetical protein
MTEETPPNPLNDYFRVRKADRRWFFEVTFVEWPHPYEPLEVWRQFRVWKTEPTPERLAKARIAATQRYFRTCTRCQALCNRGHMHDLTTCQSCAEKFLGVVY